MLNAIPLDHIHVMARKCRERTCGCQRGFCKINAVLMDAEHQLHRILDEGLTESEAEIHAMLDALTELRKQYGKLGVDVTDTLDFDAEFRAYV